MGMAAKFSKTYVPMNWDKGLEQIAEKWARKCIWKHNPNRGGNGENMYMKMGAGGCKGDDCLFKEVQSWEKQKKNPNVANDSGYGKGYGHLSQVIWQDSTKVGCASADCRGQRTIVVCNYHKHGNMVGEKAMKY